MYFQTPGADVTLTLYVHEGSASGPLLSGVRVTGQDGAENSFDKTTGSGGYVAITGTLGSWQFTASKSGYQTNSWTQSITETCTRHAFLIRDDRVNGIDVSHWQGTIDWSQVYNSGYKFAFAKASEGYGLEDSYFTANMNNGYNAGMLMGAYHFARPDLGNDAADEARYFVSVTGTYLKAGYLRPVLDLERGEELGKEALSNWVHEWMNTVKSETGIEPIIYVNSNYANNYLDSSVTQYDLWIAHWRCDTGTPPNTGIWNDWDFWQYYSPDYCGVNSVPGISGGVDLDIFNGDMDRLYTFVIEECCGTLGVNPTTWSPPTLNCGDSDSKIVTVSATGGTVNGVTVSKISGETWLTLSQTNLGDIPSGSSKTFTMTASPPSDTKGDFPYTVTVSNTCGSPSSIDVSGTIHVDCCGNIYATSNPSGANVYLDGTYKGVSPLTISNVPVGQHTVKFTKTGYDDCEKTVTVVANQQTNVHCDLQSEDTISPSAVTDLAIVKASKNRTPYICVGQC